MERNVCLLLDDLFLKGGCDSNCSLIVCEYDTFKTILNTKFNEFLFKGYLLLRNYELITWNSKVYWNNTHHLRCSCIVLYVKKIIN